MGRGPLRRIAGCLVAGASLFAALAVAPVAAQTLPPLPPVGGQPSEDSLVQDGLDALGGLISADSCAELDAVDGDAGNGIELPYFFCDDGVPPSGGGGAGVPVPVKYQADRGDDWTGLPPAATAEEVAEAGAEDLRPETGNRITLDVNVTLPPSAAIRSALSKDGRVVRSRKGGYPVIVFMHGCCGGNKTSWEAAQIDAERELWHHSNAWFASRGYVVITYTARGFRNSANGGSTGTTQLDSRRYEVNDYQYLTGLLAAHDAMRRGEGQRPLFGINPKKVGAVGGSYGGGFSWLAITDPTWKVPGRNINMRLAAAVPKYGWTDLVEALVPAGHYFDKSPSGRTRIAPSDPRKALSRSPIGVEKQSIVSGLYATGNLMASDHTTFPQYIHDGFARLQEGEPYDGDPDLENLVDRFLKDRSAYFQQSFWRRVSNGMRVPIYAGATFTDPLFPLLESLRFYNRLKRINPRYPIGMYMGDFQHFVANKAKEWNDICGNDHHVCTLDDYRSSSGALRLNAKPKRLVRVGANTYINRFLDFYLLGRGKRAPLGITAATTICASNATEKLPAAEPGLTYRAPTWRKLTGAKPLGFGWSGGGAVFGTTATAGVDNHADESDPVVRDRQTDKCHTTSEPPGAGVVELVSDEIKKSFTLMGAPILTLKYETSATDFWIGARLYDRRPDGTQTMVTRGVCRVNEAASERTCNQFALFGNAWKLDKGHRIVVELSQSDTPFLRRDNVPSTIGYPDIQLTMPRATQRYLSDSRR